MVIYVGYSSSAAKRIRSNHCSGNVESSAMREHIAARMGYKINKTERPSGSTKKRIDLPDPNQGEEKISAYLRSGWWKFVICESTEEAKDFEGYVISKLTPLLNVDECSWRRENEQ